MRSPYAYSFLLFLLIFNWFKSIREIGGLSFFTADYGHLSFNSPVKCINWSWLRSPVMVSLVLNNFLFNLVVFCVPYLRLQKSLSLNR